MIKKKSEEHFLPKRNKYHPIHRSIKIDFDVEINKKKLKFNIKNQIPKDASAKSYQRN